MRDGTENSNLIYPIFEKMLPREKREAKINQKGHVIWLFGYSGSGKSTLALMLEQALFNQDYTTCLLDGDNVRSGLSANLGFSDEDREENIRRVACVAQLLVQAGFVVIVSLITPREAFRKLAERLVGAQDISLIYVDACLQTCEKRDPKKLYGKVKSQDFPNLTGKGSVFEQPKSKTAFHLENNKIAIEESFKKLLAYVLTKIKW